MAAPWPRLEEQRSKSPPLGPPEETEYESEVAKAPLEDRPPKPDDENPASPPHSSLQSDAVRLFRPRPPPISDDEDDEVPSSPAANFGDPTFHAGRPDPLAQRQAVHSGSGSGHQNRPPQRHSPRGPRVPHPRARRAAAEPRAGCSRLPSRPSRPNADRSARRSRRVSAEQNRLVAEIIQRDIDVLSEGRLLY